MEQNKIAIDPFDDNDIKDRNGVYRFYGSSTMFHHY